MIHFFAEAVGPHVSIKPDILFELGPIPVTNSMLLGLLGYAIVIGVFVATAMLIKRGSRSRFMHGILWLFEMLFNTVQEVTGSREKAKKLAPLAITMFVLILVSNWMGLLPFVGPITYNGMPLFRGMAADLNVTFALAIISMVTVQIWAIKAMGFGGNLKRYFASVDGPLELISEFSRLIALSMRLFGNVFGGEVLLAVIAFLTQLAAPVALPVFMVLELFVGAVQAYVFFMLTVVFISLGSSHGDEEHAEHTDSSETNSPVPATEASGASGK